MTKMSFCSNGTNFEQPAQEYWRSLGIESTFTSEVVGHIQLQDLSDWENMEVIGELKELRVL